MDLEALYDPDKDPSKNPQLRPPEPVKLTVKEMAASAVSRLVLGLILFLAFLMGGWVAGTALHDPDTCWLLALGRLILDSGLPSTDPFSWTFAAAQAEGRHFILYQWLSEVLFYLSTIPGGLVTLLMLTATVVVTAFLSLPIGIVVRRNPPFLVGLFIVFLGILAASFHTLARPEIFSFMFLALFLQVLHYARMTVLAGGGRLFRIAFVLAPLMVLWCNMHTGFISGFSVVAACALGSLSGFFFKSPRQDLFRQSALALLACLLASLATPYAFQLWVYIPDLFGSPINKYIQELKPVTFNTLANPTYWPYLSLCLTFTALWLREIFQPVKIVEADLAQGQEKVEGFAQIRRVELLIALLMGGISIWCGFSHRRLITFSALILVGEICALLGLRRLKGLKVETDPSVLTLTGLKESPQPAPSIEAGPVQEQDPQAGSPSSPENSDGPVNGKSKADNLPFWQYLDLHSLDLWKSGGAFELAIVSFFAIAGVSLVAHRIARPELPGSSVAFKAPFAAVKFIENNPARLGRKLFNDAQFGDVLIWQLKGNPQVFLDTRFDMYGPKLAGQYQTLLECLDGWQRLLDNYQIDWVFVRPDAPLAKALMADSNWRQIYRDDAAVILRRQICD